MRVRTTFLLLLAVCIAGGAYWLIGGAEESDIRHRNAAARAFAIRPGQILELVLERDDLRIECHRVGGVWRLVMPVNARADAAEMDRILTVLAKLSRGEVITAADRRDLGLTLADYGLERPSAQIEWSDGARRRILRIGRSAPVGTSVYVMLEGSEDILAVPETLLHVWPDSVVSLRDRILFHGDPRRAARVEIRRTGGFLQLQRGEDGSWRIHQPLSARADPVAVRQWIDRLFELRIVEFMADVVSDPSVYGLDDSATQISVLAEGQTNAQTLWLGRPIDNQPDWVYARRQDSDSIFAVSATAVESARVRPSDLRNRTLVPLSEAAITRIEVREGDAHVILKHDGRAWQIQHPRHSLAEQDYVEALVAAWTGARIERFVDSPLNHPAYAGITPASLSIQLSVPERNASAGDAQWRNVNIVVSDDRLPEGGLLVRRDQDPSLYEISADPMAATTADFLHYRDRQIMALEPAMVTRIQQSMNGHDIVLHPNGTGAFVPHSEIKQSVDTNQLKRAVRVLLTLRADEFLADQPDDWARYGLDDPGVSWFVRLDADAGIARSLRIGSVRPDGRAYARTLGQSTLFLLSPDDTQSLTQSLVRSGEHSVIIPPNEREEQQP